MKRLGVNILIIGIVFSTSIILLFFYLDYFTQHGEKIMVPDFIGKTETQIQPLLGEYLKYKITDSIYDKNSPRGIILDQEPKARVQVKPGRTIYFTINRIVPKLVPIPEVVDKRLRIGLEHIQMAGFEIGKIDTVEFDFPIIVALMYKGRKLLANEKLQEGSIIDMQVGRGK